MNAYFFLPVLLLACRQAKLESRSTPHSTTSSSSMELANHSDVIHQVANQQTACPLKCKCDSNFTFVTCAGAGLDSFPRVPLSVTELNLQGNYIKTIKVSDLNQTPLLITLDISNNLLASIDDFAFNGSHNLSKLDISNNKVTSLRQETFSGLIGLRELDLSENELRCLNASTFKGMPSLLSLRLFGCYLNRIQNYTFLGLRALQSLVLENNQLAYKKGTFDAMGFAGLESLTSLVIHRNNHETRLNKHNELNLNKVTSTVYQSYDGIPIPENTTGTNYENSKIHRRRRETSDLMYPDIAISLLSNLQALVLDGLPSTDLGDGFSKLVHLNSIQFDGSDCDLEHISSKMFRAFENTTSLNFVKITNCNIVTISPHTFQPLSHILSLAMDWTFTFEWDSGTREAIHNTSVGLSGSKLRDLSLKSFFGNLNVYILPSELASDFMNFPIVSLDLSHNRLFKIEPNFLRCLPHTLEKLDLSWNYLMDAHAFVFLSCLPSILEIDLRHQVHFHSSKSHVNKTSHAEALSEQDNQVHVHTANGINISRKGQSKLSEGPDFSDSPQFQCPEGLHLAPILSSHTTMALTFCPCPRHDKFDEIKNRENHKIGISASFRSNGRFSGSFHHQIKHFKKSTESNAISVSLASDEAKILNVSERKATIPIPHISPIYYPPRTLEVLYLSDMNLKYAIPPVRFALPNSLKHLEYASNGAFCLGGPMEGIPHLEYFDLSDNKCRFVNPDFFRPLQNLTTLLLNSNTLGEALADVQTGTRLFAPLTRLVRLEMKDNLIRKLPRSMLAHNLALETLDLAHNVLEEFDLDLSDLHALRVLNLSWNEQFNGFKDVTVQQLASLQEHLKVDLRGTGLKCSCDYLPFLYFLCATPTVFVQATSLTCVTTEAFGGKQSQYPHFCPDLSQLQGACFAQDIFTAVTILACLMCSSLILVGIVVRYRWRISFLFYIGRQRLHIGGLHITYQPIADIFLTFDNRDEDVRPKAGIISSRLENIGFKVIVPERDFPAGDQFGPASGAIVGSRKVLFLLSRGVFDDLIREFEFNMTVMYEMQQRRSQLVVVWLETVNIRRERYPPEVISFLENHAHQCIHQADAQFWHKLRSVLGQPDRTP